MKKVGTLARVDDELAVVDPDAHARQRAAHRAGAPALAGGRGGEVGGLGLAVAVADRRGRWPRARRERLGVERLAGGDEAPQRGTGVRVARLAMRRYSVGAMQRMLTRSRSTSSSRSAGSKRASCSSRRRRTARERRTRCVRTSTSRMRPCTRPPRRARRRATPGHEPLAGQVALGVDDRLGPAGGAAREDDQARVVEGELDGGGGSAA